MNSNITTKGGDDGSTSKYTGERIAKNSLEMEIVGTIDELVSMLGVARTFSKNDAIKKKILKVQRQLFDVASDVSSYSPHTEMKPIVDEAFMNAFELKRELFEEMSTFPEDFVIPGGEDSKSGAFIDSARAICRRCERLMSSFCFPKEDGFLILRGEIVHFKYVPNKNLFIYMNRLSDYLWLLARKEEDKTIMQKGK